MEFCDCTENCKSKEHGDKISAVLTKRDLTDAQICTYLNQICYNCESVRDGLGRTALHVAASVGRNEVVRWLIRRKANLNAKDRESSYTPLHRSIYYGNIHVAIALLQSSAANNILDNDGLTYLDHAMKNWPFGCHSEGGQVYIWGPDANYVFGAKQSRSVPEYWEMYHKEYSSEIIRKICLDKFHCVAISNTGGVYSCGHGQGGRLGLGNERTALKPGKVMFSDKQSSSPFLCISASISRDHSVFLTECEGKRQVWSCGLNTHHALGISPPPPNLVSPRRLNTLKNATIKGVCTGRYHSIAWNENLVFSWGLHAGQLGHDASPEKYIITPKLISKIRVKSELLDVTTSMAATVVLTKLGEILIFHQYKCVTVPTRGPLTKVCAIGGKLNMSLDISLSDEKSDQELKIAALTPNGKILLWYESDTGLIQCIMSLNREIIVTDIALTMNGIAFISNEGEAFTGIIKQRKKDQFPISNKQNAFNQFLDRDKCHYIKLCKLAHVHRAISIATDPAGTNFAVIQADPKINLHYPQSVSGNFTADLKELMETAELDDFVHDVQFTVGLQTFAAHKYILVNSSKVMQDYKNSSYNLDKINPELFQELLTWIYTGDCTLVNIGECPNHLCTNAKEKNAVRLLQDLAKGFAITDLETRLSKLTMNGSKIDYAKKEQDFIHTSVTRTFNRLDFPELYDVSIIAKNGQSLLAHKCILITRVELFRNIYSNRWNTQFPSGKVELPFTYNVLELFLEYIYTDMIPSSNTVDIDTLCHLLELSDQYLIERLHNLCQIELSSRLSLKNAIEILNISTMYNANDLKRCTMQFICSNLATFLDSKALQDLSDDLLLQLTKHYCSTIKQMQNRIITPYSTAASDEDVFSVIENCGLEAEIITKPLKTTPKSHRTRYRSHKDSITENCNREDLLGSTIICDVVLGSSPKIEVPIQENKEIIMPSRIRAITLARDKVSQEKNEQNFTKLCIADDRNFMGHDEFPTLGLSPPTNKVHRKHSGEKRHNYRQSQEKKMPVESPVGNSPKQESNPWKINMESTIAECQLGKISKAVDMETILLEEKQQKEKINRMLSKPLAYTQIEDKALEDLTKFYNCSNIFDELITMERVRVVEIGIQPTWATKKQKA